MERKLDITLGLIHRPKVLFLDEPTTGLDPEARSALWTLIEDLAESGLTILLTITSKRPTGWRSVSPLSIAAAWWSKASRKILRANSKATRCKWFLQRRKTRLECVRH